MIITWRGRYNGHVEIFIALAVLGFVGQEPIHTSSHHAEVRDICCPSFITVLMSKLRYLDS
jgi:hypothetical protein